MKTKLNCKGTGYNQGAWAMPTTVVALLFSGGLLCGLGLLTLAAPGCASMPAGRGSPGDLPGPAKAAPMVVTVSVPPWNSIAEAALGLISAGLATWNVQQHRRLAALEAERK